MNWLRSDAGTQSLTPSAQKRRLYRVNVPFHAAINNEGSERAALSIPPIMLREISASICKPPSKTLAVLFPIGFFA